MDTEDRPRGIWAILDHPEYADRYTVIYSDESDIDSGVKQYLGASANPSHPQGVGLHGEMPLDQAIRYVEANHLHLIDWKFLPQAVRDVVVSDLSD